MINRGGGDAAPAQSQPDGMHHADPSRRRHSDWRVRRRAHAMTYDEKLASCLACHGEKGISETSEVPSLAGMPADFTLIQLFLFRQGPARSRS